MSNLSRFSTITFNNAIKYPLVAMKSNGNSPLLLHRCNSMELTKFLKPLQRCLATSSSLKSTVDQRGHNHATMWSVERFLASALIVIIPATFVLCNPIMDNIFAVTVVAHSHW